MKGSHTPAVTRTRAGSGESLHNFKDTAVLVWEEYEWALQVASSAIDRSRGVAI
jgi:hypothetical protein